MTVPGSSANWKIPRFGAPAIEAVMAVLGLLGKPKDYAAGFLEELRDQMSRVKGGQKNEANRSSSHRD
jgi:hypothetical protein